MKFSDMSEFPQGYQFFMLRPSHAVGSFIVTMAVIVVASITWALIAKMDDTVKATALLRPATAVSVVKSIVSGEVLEKLYVNDEYVNEGTLLLQTDVSSDSAEFENSQKLMEQIAKNTVLYTNLLATIRSDQNAASKNDEEAYIRSEAYLIEKQKILGQINDLRVKLNREKTLPGNMTAAQKLEDIEREIQDAELQFSLWKNNQMIDAMTKLQTLQQNEVSLERRLTDLERNIKNANLRAPISGRVSEIRKLNTGDYILSGEQLLSIVPDDENSLKAEVYVDSAYIARIKPGQHVSLRFPGLPPSKFGKLDAQVSLIPADYTIGPDEKPIFIVEAQLPEPYLISANGTKTYLRAGIGAVGRIIVAQDTVMMMILEKLDFINDDIEDTEELAKEGK